MSNDRTRLKPCTCACSCDKCTKTKRGSLAQTFRRRSAVAERGGRESPRTPSLPAQSSPSQSTQPLTTTIAEERIVRLNVGGVHCATTLSSLLAGHEPRSFFHGLFSGYFKEPSNSTSSSKSDQEYIIDRDGRHFHELLCAQPLPPPRFFLLITTASPPDLDRNWLRNPEHFIVPSDAQDRMALWLEADFYGLEGLCQRLEAAEEVRLHLVSTRVTNANAQGQWGDKAFHVKLLDDTRYPQPPRRFEVTLPGSATFGQLRFVICALVGYQPQHFDLLIDYSRKVPRTADHQLIASWNLRPGELTLLRARGFSPKNLSYVRPRILPHTSNEQRDPRERFPPDQTADPETYAIQLNEGKDQLACRLPWTHHF